MERRFDKQTHMNIQVSELHSSRIRRAVAAGLTASLIGIAAELYAAEIEEIVVTARKQSEPLQDAAITVQAMPEDALDDLQIDQLTDYVQYLPNVTAGGRGPAQNEIYIRGLAVDQINITVAEAQGSAPNVALYLNEQPVTAGGRNLDVYAADLSRIEVLPGPQGTLYGSSSQAGTVRLITNVPVIDETEFNFTAAASLTDGGDASNSIEAVFNLPVIDNKLAVRGVIFNDSMGGYIDNIAETFWPDPKKNPRLPSPNGIVFVKEGGGATSHEFADGTFAVPGKTYEVEYQPTYNSILVEKNFNDALYTGFRIGAKYLVNDDWDITVLHHQQQIESQGVFDYDAELGDLKVARFVPEVLDEQFGQTSWTLEGRLAQLDLIYTGAYLSREIAHIVDYTEYANVGGYIAGYLCEYNTPGYHGGGGAGYVFDPTLSGDPEVIECEPYRAHAALNNTGERFNHELRIQGSFTERFEYTAGIFYQDYKITHIGDFDYNIDWPAIDPARISRHTANSLEIKAPGIQFVNDITRPEREMAYFGELTTFLHDKLEATVGFRTYRIEAGFEGFSAFRYGSRPMPNLIDELGVDGANPNNVGGRDYIDNLHDFQPLTLSDTIAKLSLAWRPHDRFLTYATVSQGYRPPGFNRAAAAGAATAEGVAARSNDGPGGFPDYWIPVVYNSDQIDNYEVGWKWTSADRSLAWNGTAYYIDWREIQVSHFDSQNISIFTIVDNGGDAEIVGLESNFEYWPTDRLALWAGVSVNKTELVKVNPAFAFVVADVGSELPLTPQFQLTGRGRYTWDSHYGEAFFQLSGAYSGESWNSLVDIPITDPRKRQDSHLILDAALGVQSNAGWRIEGYAQNITDTRAQLHINRLDFRERITTNRPLTVGWRIRYEY